MLNEVHAEIAATRLLWALGFFVETGARDETDEVSGVSHFLEHMVFKGTPKRSADDVNREFDEMGAHYNAFTSEESTVYYAAVLPEYLDRLVELWADVLRTALREEDFTTEKNVILEEMARRGLRVDAESASFFTSKGEIVSVTKPRGLGLRRMLFMWMLQNAPTVADYLRLPPDRVVELRTQLAV